LQQPVAKLPELVLLAGIPCAGHPEKYLVELGTVFSFVGFKPEYAGKLNYYCSTDANAPTQISRQPLPDFSLVTSCTPFI